MGAHRRQIRRRHAGGGRKQRGGASSAGLFETASSVGGDFDGGSLGSASAACSPRAVSEYDLGGSQFDFDCSDEGKGGDIRMLARGFEVKEGLSGDDTELVLNRCRYHPKNPCSQLVGYSGSLTSSHEAAVGALCQWLTRESVDLSPLLGETATADMENAEACRPEAEDFALLRFLRHNNWNVEQTRAQLETNLAWRVEKDIVISLQREPWEVAGCKDAETFDSLCRTYYPHYTLGGDRLGRPILLQKYGNFDTAKLQECTTMEGLLSYHAWEQEKNAELLRRATVRTGYLVETYTMIMDFGGMGIRLVNGDFLWLLRELSEMDRNFYPGRGGVTYVINTPPLFGFVWAGIRSFMETTQARIHIFGKEEEWKAALSEAIDPKQLPVEYGGSAPPLAETPFLPAVHQALQQNQSIVGGRPIDDFIVIDAPVPVEAADPSNGNSAYKEGFFLPLSRCSHSEGGSSASFTRNDGHTNDQTLDDRTNGHAVRENRAGGSNIYRNCGDAGRHGSNIVDTKFATRKVIDISLCKAFYYNRSARNDSNRKSSNCFEVETIAVGVGNKSPSNGFRVARNGSEKVEHAAEATTTALTSPSVDRANPNGVFLPENSKPGGLGWVVGVLPGGRLAVGIAGTVMDTTLAAVGFVVRCVFSDETRAAATGALNSLDFSRA